MEQQSAQPASHAGRFDVDLALREVDAALKDALLRYAEALPPDLITLGKMALHARGKVMAWSRAQETGAEAALPRWPLFVLLGCRAALPPGERDPWREAVPAAVAVEIAVAAADLIDEWTDGDDSPILEEYGPEQAINAANLMLVMAQQVMLWEAQRPGGSVHAVEALGALQDMLVEAAVGQHLDMAYERMGYRDVTPEMSGEMTDRKAGALIGGACRMGALMADADDEVARLVWQFGRQVGGMAQLANDIQDVLPLGTQVVASDGSEVSDPAAAPKTDLARRKRTRPVAGLALGPGQVEVRLERPLLVVPPQLGLVVALGLRHATGCLRRRPTLGQRPSRTRLLGASLAALLARLPLGASVVLGLAEELCQRPFAHARPLTASHWPGPPRLADGRRRPPSRPGRT